MLIYTNGKFVKNYQKNNEDFFTKKKIHSY